MQTNFTLAQLADPDIAEADRILRSCVHCGFCTATCPTFVLLGDELDSPRGRIYLIKDLLENDKPASPKVARHIDRCLSCLSCMTTCPSGVHYMHLVDIGRKHVEATLERPAAERALRRLLALVLPRPRLFRLALLGASIARPFHRIFPGRVAAMLALAPRRLAAASDLERPQIVPADGPRRARVALLTGCAQPVLRPEINEATVRLLTRHGVEVVIAKGAGCCGALAYHMGQEEPAIAFAKANIAAWLGEAERGGLDAIIINASGCGTTIKDYGHMLRQDSEWAEPAARISALAKDVTEFLTDFGLPAASRPTGQTVAYHSACSMQHGQQITEAPKALLRQMGYHVKDVPEGHLCCGSAGTYNILQPELAGKLRARKAANIEATKAGLVATGNIGCIVQLADAVRAPVLHSVELLDWATGGPRPPALKDREMRAD